MNLIHHNRKRAAGQGERKAVATGMHRLTEGGMADFPFPHGENLHDNPCLAGRAWQDDSR